MESCLWPLAVRSCLWPLTCRVVRLGGAAAGQMALQVLKSARARAGQSQGGAGRGQSRPGRGQSRAGRGKSRARGRAGCPPAPPPSPLQPAITAYIDLASVVAHALLHQRDQLPIESARSHVDDERSAPNPRSSRVWAGWAQRTRRTTTAAGHTGWRTASAAAPRRGAHRSRARSRGGLALASPPPPPCCARSWSGQWPGSACGPDHGGQTDARHEGVKSAWFKRTGRPCGPIAQCVRVRGH